jgi:hypothetical protein
VQQQLGRLEWLQGPPTGRCRCSSCCSGRRGVRRGVQAGEVKGAEECTLNRRRYSAFSGAVLLHAEWRAVARRASQSLQLAFSVLCMLAGSQVEPVSTVHSLACFPSVVCSNATSEDLSALLCMLVPSCSLYSPSSFVSAGFPAAVRAGPQVCSLAQSLRLLQLTFLSGETSGGFQHH